MTDRSLRRSLEATLRRAGATPEEAEEAVNDAFAAEAAYGGEVANRSAFLHTVARRRWASHVRRETRAHVRSHEDLAGMAGMAWEPDPAEGVVDRIAMAELLQELQPRERDGLLLRADGYPTADAAERLGMSAAAYRKMVSRTIPRLRGAWQAAARAIWLPVGLRLRRAQNRLNVTAETGSLVAASTLTAVAVAVAPLAPAPLGETDETGPAPRTVATAPLTPAVGPIAAPARAVDDSSSVQPVSEQLEDDETAPSRRPRVRVRLDPRDDDPSLQARAVRPAPVPETGLTVQLTCGDLGLVGELVCSGPPEPTTAPLGAIGL